ncbi:hypothetical protein DENIS_0567 [Desulfonema ishimotonii]|uniref:GAK system XXXCH domain-containing protein n=1 Tax=Desulfonema ishimotonii TaxID=45657 RepID=A0A401FRP2_9BACT|nr:GAK system XXXCH domain-containing protein [Desulfonema ishimotonii]GBC59628.1 hypothetical protein DENIS_0567 [Desulfonema ishimotonii]
MSGGKISYSGLTGAQLARFFRDMADTPEGKTSRTSPEFNFDPGNFRKLKIGLKKEPDGFSLKIRAKQPREAACGTAQAETGTGEEAGDFKYNTLKKRMKSRFKTICESLANNTLPGEAVVTAFLRDSRLMTAWPDYGDEYYEAYDQACTAFREAFESKNLEACKTTCQELSRLKKECHDRYK